MAVPMEIERKFLLLNDDWRSDVIQSTHFHQGYLSSNPKSSVRIRIEGDMANINIKSATIGMSRAEYEYAIPLAEAKQLLDTLCEQPQISKTRHIVAAHADTSAENSAENGAPLTWEIDEFHGDNAGLIVAEIELSDETQAFLKPAWLGQEVTDDIRYYNSCLAKHPYCEWS